MNQDGTFDPKLLNSIIEKSVDSAVCKAFKHFENEFKKIIDEKMSDICERVTILEIGQEQSSQNFEDVDDKIKKIEVLLEEKNEQILKLESKLNHLEQYSRKCHIRVFGVQESQNENCVDIVNGIIKDKLNIDCNVHIDVAHRVGPIRGSTAKPRGIIARFSRYCDKQLVIAARSKLKNSGIVIADDMTRTNVRLIEAAKSNKNVKRAWFTNGKIMVESLNGKKIKLEQHMDLNKSLAN